jgi:hypothetical protein
VVIDFPIHICCCKSICPALYATEARDTNPPWDARAGKECCISSLQNTFITDKVRSRRACCLEQLVHSLAVTFFFVMFFPECVAQGSLYSSHSTRALLGGLLDCFLTAQVETLPGSADMEQRVSRAGLTWPLVVKPQVACGPPQAHCMAIVFNMKGLAAAQVPTPAILQRFVDHAGVVHKVYVIGDKVTGPARGLCH